MSETALNRKTGESVRRKAKEDELLGKFYDQTFYVLRYQKGCTLEFPFRSQSFNAFISIDSEYPPKILEQIAFSLLKQGMRFALCHGKGAEALAEIIDRLIDEHRFSHNGFTAYSSSHTNETLEEAMEYFMLPNGLAEIGLILVIGDEAAQQKVAKTFSRIIGAMDKIASMPPSRILRR
ncbi:MAG: hypothetical protein N3A66_05555 [Planctomycetota bacterium]|nr:hypothetical protein [Planctomycetota bacterium]